MESIKALVKVGFKINFLTAYKTYKNSVISYILPNTGPKINVPAEYRPVISHPSGFEHQVHVGFDPETGEFSGLPDTWARILQHSDISVTERKKNPKGLLEVMGFWNENRFERPEPKVSICESVKKALFLSFENKATVAHHNRYHIISSMINSQAI